MCLSARDCLPLCPTRERLWVLVGWGKSVGGTFAAKAGSVRECLLMCPVGGGGPDRIS